MKTFADTLRANRPPDDPVRQSDDRMKQALDRKRAASAPVVKRKKKKTK
jgi:hypothetical protein